MEIERREDGKIPQHFQREVIGEWKIGEWKMKKA